MRNIVSMARNFSVLLCLCGFLTAQAEPQQCGENLFWEMDGTTLRLTQENPDSLASMWSETEYPWETYRDQITSIVCPDSLVDITTRAFQNCTALTNIDLRNVQTISTYAFYQCTNLKQVILPDSVINVGAYAFQNCTSLTLAKCRPIDPPVLGTAAFAGCAADFSVCVTHEDSYGPYCQNEDWNDYTVTICSDTPTDIEIVESSSLQAGDSGRLILENNELLILRNNEKYTITGQKL